MKKIFFLTLAYVLLFLLQIEIASAQIAPSPVISLYSPQHNPWANLEGFKDLLSNDLFTGEMRFGIPFDLPKGRGNLTPELNLTYSSFKKDFVSPYGYGWDLSTSSIFRIPKKGINAMYSNNEFAVRLGGKYNELTLVDASIGLYMGKLGNDADKYFLEGDQWRVQDDEGTVHYFGTTVSSRQGDPADASRIFQWMLTKTEDSNGNRIEYTYFEDRGQIYGDTIEYVFTGTQSLYRIDLEYLSKSTAIKSYQTGFPVSTYLLLRRINLQIHEGSWTTFRQYNFTYDSLSDPISRLTEITPQAGVTTLPPFQFTYYTEGSEVNLLKTIRNTVGAEIEAEYLPSTVYRDSMGSPNRLPFVIHTLHKLIQRDLLTGKTTTKSFAYHQAHYFYDSANVFEREYAGFHEVIAEDDISITKTYFHQSQFAKDNGKSALAGEFDDHISKKGRIYREEWQSKSNQLQKSQITKWKKKDMGNNRFLVTKDRVTVPNPQMNPNTRA